MSAIEIYQKIIDATKDADVKDAYTAMNFAQNEINNRFYSQEKQSAYLNQGALLGAGQYAPTPTHDQAVDMVRKIAQEEIAKANEMPAEQAA